MEKIYSDTAKNIDEICREETFYKSGEDCIRGVLKAAKRVKAETGKRIIEGLWKVYGQKCLDLLCDIDIDFGANIEVEVEFEDESKFSKYISFSQKLKDIFCPLFDIKIAGIKVFKFIIEHYEREEKKKYKESLHIEGDEGTEEGELEVDWEGTYEEVRSEISKLFQEEKFKEAKEEIKKIREIPLKERVKIAKSTFEKIKNIGGVTEAEAVRKHVKNIKDQEECLKILKDIREGKMKIEDRDGYCSGEYLFSNDEKINDPLLKAVKQAIEANDLPSLITLSRGCFLPSDKSIRLDSELTTYSLFRYSCMVYAVDCALYLLEAGGGIEQKFTEGDTPLHQTLKGGNEKIGMFLIERGVDCSAIGQSKFTTLHAASAGNCIEVAKLLIERGANIESKDKFGRTSLHMAAYWNSYDVAKLLIEKGADVEAKDEDGETPLHKAAWDNSYEVSKLLIERGADIETKDNLGKTPLHIAAEKNSYEVSKFLIERGANIEAKDKYGKTPLHLSSLGNSYEIAKLLIEKGADIEAKDKYFGRTPLHMAAKENRVEVTELLIERGADTKAKNEYGEAPLQLTHNDQIKELIRKAAKLK